MSQCWWESNNSVRRMNLGGGVPQQDGAKWTKIIEATPVPRCKMKYGSHEI